MNEQINKCWDIWAGKVIDTTIQRYNRSWPLNGQKAWLVNRKEIGDVRSRLTLWAVEWDHVTRAGERDSCDSAVLLDLLYSLKLQREKQKKKHSQGKKPFLWFSQIIACVAANFSMFSQHGKQLVLVMNCLTMFYSVVTSLAKHNNIIT